MREWKKPSVNDQSAGSLNAYGNQVSRLGPLRLSGSAVIPGTSRTKYNITPTPAIDGVTVTFSVATASPTSTFVANSTRVFFNGMRQKLGTHYTESPAAGTITFLIPPDINNGWEDLIVDFDY